MKNQFKYSILITLTVLITSLLLVQAHAPIGTDPQRSPFEANPTATSYFMVGGPSSAGRDAMKDGDLGTLGDFFLGAPHILRPDGDGQYVGWTAFPAGLLDYFCWKEETSDGEATYLTISTATTKESSTLEDPPADASGTISSVKVYFVARSTTAGGTVMPMLRLGTTDQLGTSQALTTSYVLYSQTVARPGGGPWTWTDIANLQAGVQTGTGTLVRRVTQLYVEVIGPTTGYFELNTFTTPALTFPIGFVDLKMKYKVDTAPADDTYKIEYTTDGITWATLQADTGNVFDRDMAEAVRPWSQISAMDGAWDWTDVGSLRFRITATQNGGSWDAVKMTVFEMWASICPPWDIPPSGSVHVAVIPSGVYKVNAAEMMFVDIYVTGVNLMRGFYLFLTYDNLTLTPNSYFIYDPFQYVTPGNVLDDTQSMVVLQQTGKSDTPPLNGSAPIARIYFDIDQAGSSKLNIVDPIEFAEGTFPALVTETKLKDIYATNMPYIAHDGWMSALKRYMSFVNGILPPGPPALLPPNNGWHEEYPDYSHSWTLTSWNDNGDGYLSESDQIDMTNATGWIYWFHVDTVTITIHFTFKPDGTNPTGEIAKAESDPPITEMPTGSPEGTTWHQIYGPPLGGGSSSPDGFCRPFTITSWVDNTPGSPGVPNGVFDASDQFDFTYGDEAEPVTYWAHLDKVTTDIIVSQKPIPPIPGGGPEFPLGIGLLMLVAPAISIAYLWRTRSKKTRKGE